MSEKWIVREEYLSKLTALQNKKIIKVVTGVRRCVQLMILIRNICLRLMRIRILITMESSVLMLCSGCLGDGAIFNLLSVN